MAAPGNSDDPSGAGELVLATGHRLVSCGDGREPQVQVIGPAGDVQLSIRLTPSGPVVQLQAARLELSAKESLSLTAPRVEIRTSDGFSVQSGGAMALEASEILAQASGDIRLDGRTLLLNCEEGEEPHDQPE